MLSSYFSLESALPLIRIPHPVSFILSESGHKFGYWCSNFRKANEFSTNAVALSGTTLISADLQFRDSSLNMSPTVAFLNEELASGPKCARTARVQYAVQPNQESEANPVDIKSIPSQSHLRRTSWFQTSSVRH